MSPRLRWPRRAEGPSCEWWAHRRDGEERAKSGRKARAMVDGQRKASQESAANNGQPASQPAISLSLSLSSLCLSLLFSVLFSPRLASPRFVSCEPAIVRLPAQAGLHPRLRPCGAHPPAMNVPLLLPGKLQPSIWLSLSTSTAALPCLGGERE